MNILQRLLSQQVPSMSLDNSKDSVDIMRRFIDALHADGIDEWVSLPEIAVMGDTSSGKSSLLSALSGILLPANHQLTTRCPTRMRMEMAPQRTATVRIRWHAASTYRSEAYPVTHLSEEGDGDKFASRLTEEIEKAQQTIIDASPSEVARDIIEVDFFGPDLYNLTITDLPGIVRVAGRGESSRIIEDIQLLIKEYLENERCVVLAVVPANVDFHNSGIMADAEKNDPSTRRTIPVITKPDLIDRGAEGGVRDLLLGLKTEKFQMGFHIVKCRGQQQLNDGVTLDQGLEAEAHYFCSQEPWSKERKKQPGLFGVPALRGKLADLQMRMIQDSIPSILQDLERERGAASVQRDSLGYALTTPYECRGCFVDAVAAATAQYQHQTGHGRGIDGERPSTKLQNARTSFASRIVSSHRSRASKARKESLQKIISDQANKDLSCFLSAKVFNSFVADMVNSNWAPLCDGLITDTRDTTQQYIVQAFSDALPERFPAASAYVLGCVAQVCDECVASVLEPVAAVLTMERTPLLQDVEVCAYIQAQRNERLKHNIVNLLSYRGINPITTVREAFEASAKRPLLQHSVDEMQTVLDSHGNVAAKKIADRVCMIADQMTDDILVKIGKRLADVTDDTLQRIMRDLPEVEAQQQSAAAKVWKMERAMEAVRRLQL